MNMVILVLLILLMLGALPQWPYSATWGYAPSGAIGLMVLIILILAIMGRL